MKIKVLRQSGNPVKTEYIEQIRLASNAIYDRVMEKHKIKNTAIMDADKSVYLTKLLSRLEKRIIKQYPSTEEWDLPVTPDMWSELTKQYGPIAVASETESGALALIIMDAGF